MLGIVTTHSGFCMIHAGYRDYTHSGFCMIQAGVYRQCNRLLTRNVIEHNYIIYVAMYKLKDSTKTVHNESTEVQTLGVIRIQL